MSLCAVSQGVVSLGVVSQGVVWLCVVSQGVVRCVMLLLACLNMLNMLRKNIYISINSFAGYNYNYD